MWQPPRRFDGGGTWRAACVPGSHPRLPAPPPPPLRRPQRFRECELIHGRWAMLATLGALVQEGVTGDSWVAAQTIVYDAPQYAGVQLPFDIYTLAILNSLLMGGVELFRNSELDPERRCYPGAPRSRAAAAPLRLPLLPCPRGSSVGLGSEGQPLPACGPGWPSEQRAGRAPLHAPPCVCSHSTICALT